MTVQYNGLLAQTMQQALKQQLQSKLAAWAKQWFVAPEPIVVFESVVFSQRMFAVENATIEPQNLLCSFDDCALACSKEPSVPLAGLTLPFDSSNDADVELIEFTNDILLAELSNAIQLDDSQRVEFQGSFDYACKITLTLCNLELTLYLSALYLHRFSLSQAEKRPKRDFSPLSLKQLAADQPLTMALTMETQAVSVSQLMSLKVGHVIPLKQPIKQPLRLIAGQAATQLKGFLVKSQGQKAVYITGIAK